MGINNPLPSSMASECKKCGKILTSFIDPRQAFGPDKVIPPAVLASAKASTSSPRTHGFTKSSKSNHDTSNKHVLLLQGLAILTVIKAGFLGSARFGSGLVVARLPDGSWSAPSAIATGGAGFGGQIGFELTDFVFILNDASAVKTFSQAGSLTLGGNVSIAAGPVGRNAEAAGAASLRSVAGIFSYSKTKGLFAGVSLEGSAIIERKDANAKLYGRPISAKELLNGAERPPPQASPLFNVLNSRAFSGTRSGNFDDSMYNDVPVYDDRHDDVVWNGQRGNAYGEGQVNNGSSSARHSMYGGAAAASNSRDSFGAPKRASTWQDDIYDSPRQFGAGSRSSTLQDVTVPREYTGQQSGYPEDRKVGPGRPAAPKPNFTSKQALMKKNEAIALYTFEAEQPGDLGFKKGDVITVLKKTDSDNDWWTGMVGTKHGTFPSNYVKMKE